MNKFEILVDTSQDFTFEIAEKYGLELLPYYLSLDGVSYQDQIGINKEEFYRTIRQYKTLSTGIPPLQDVIDKIEELKSKGAKRFLAITSSSEVTGMINLYESIKEMVEDVEIFTFDVPSVGSGAALFSLYASQLRDKGYDIQEIIEKLEAVKDSTSIYAIFRELEYLVKGGRMSAVKAAIGGFLNISPILNMQDRKVDIFEKARGKKKSLERLAQIIIDDIGDAKDYFIGIFQADNQEEMDKLKEMLKDQIEKSSLYIETILTPVLGTHSGPTAVGVSLLRFD